MNSQLPGPPNLPLRRLVALSLAVLAVLPVAAASKVDFNRDIRPILSENCYDCHGPDAGKRKAGLRLDLKEGALTELKSEKFAVVPGHPEKSSLIARITANDANDRMPPAKTGKRLTDAQTKLLKRWIVEGAEWKPHWAFIKPERPPVPEIKNKRWPANPIDQFILARLEKEKLKPVPEADRATLIRRVTFDLLGLPSTPEELIAFRCRRECAAGHPCLSLDEESEGSGAFGTQEINKPELKNSKRRQKQWLCWFRLSF